ncbi:MAG: GNAT family N-acetyltransferase [Pseudomonadota bacterium]
MPPIETIKIRPAREGDQGAVYGLFEEVQSLHAAAEPTFFRWPQRDNRFEAFFHETLESADQDLILACREGRPVALCLYCVQSHPETLFKQARRLVYIQALTVARAHRRQRCASALIDHVKQAAQKMGISEVGIDHWSFNDAARACFARSGFILKREYLRLDC